MGGQHSCWLLVTVIKISLHSFLRILRSRPTWSATTGRQHCRQRLTLVMKVLSNGNALALSMSMRSTRMGTQRSRWPLKRAMKALFVCFLIYQTSTPRSGVLQTDTLRCRRRRPTGTVLSSNSCKILLHLLSFPLPSPFLVLSLLPSSTSIWGRSALLLIFRKIRWKTTLIEDCLQPVSVNLG
ncbi:hypothetical protein BKA70DRAFT_885265 [Coprinopsis sp. MPI-PUGE-AT-0042]|nr:hypothetical protein BKA70DRAFT_885265 [Coprinopsis sp. MPI-PUGE-AT-0042]